MDKSGRNVQRLVDHFFRSEYGKVVSFLTRKFGTQYIELVEDAVQEALIGAMRTWPIKEVPNNPSAWVFRAASNKMIDKLRKSSKEDLTAEILIEQEGYQDISPEKIDDMLKDELLSMLFACCHPKISVEYQIILALKILCGLSIKEIATCLIKKETTVAKSYTRAKQKFAESGERPEMPEPNEISSRLSVVLKVIYLVFNEGYKTTSGKELYNLDLCTEAIRLGHLLLGTKSTASPTTFALMALMHHHMARFSSRVSVDGDLLTLEKQDRQLWDQDMIAQGNYFLNKSIEPLVYSEYHIQAAIASMHCNAPSFDDTNWTDILSLYDGLVKIKPSPVSDLNRLIPLSKVKGPRFAMEELKQIEASGFLDNYYLFHVIKGQLFSELDQIKEAKICFEKALSLTNNTLEREFIERKMID